ncbi:hypothetical protein PACTADRAFT_51995 [Pachysolen tannophilus NRRL Y-2460]|uniref:Alkyl transferase n=1 Tax=Pachysolen tannophilus NRRL Y-2460 TaxID=669874 RepID=A0A1E4TNR6_PACTA|nr:hypothetical protein PACTADRAFT_51995 [Pachysolen tannophilus NRRL Y-2460]
MVVSLIFHYLSLIPVFQYVVNFAQDFIIGILKTGPIPHHVAFVMDGNRRYAKNNTMALKEGHNAGAETLVKVLDFSYRLGIKAVTIYAFSIENFNRPKAEVDTLFELLKSKLVYISQSGEYADKHGIKIKIIGNKSMIPEEILKDLNKVEEKTAKNKTFLLNVCFPYTSRDDITNCIIKIVKKVKEEKTISIDEIDEDLLNEHMYFGNEYPNVDVLVRTSGHTRLSDFMLWQTNKDSVITFDNSLWPEFGFINYMNIILKYSYYKNLQLQQIKFKPKKSKNDTQIANNNIEELINNHPPYASVTGN